jgi:hypothetical protein
MGIYLANDKYNSNLTQSYTAGDSTIYVDTPPDNTPTIVILNRGEDDETILTAEGKTANTLTGVSFLKGTNGNHENATPVTCLNNEEFINQYDDALKEAIAKTYEIQNLTPGPATTQALDLSLANIFAVQMPAGNITLSISNPTVGQCFLVEIVQDGTGSRTVTWFTTIKWMGGSAPALTTTANKKDTFGFRVTGSGTYDGYIVGMNI